MIEQCKNYAFVNTRDMITALRRTVVFRMRVLSAQVR